MLLPAGDKKQDGEISMSAFENTDHQELEDTSEVRTSSVPTYGQGCQLKLVNRKNVDSVVQEITSYSRSTKSSLKRGQLWLSSSEAEQLKAVLKALNLATTWAFSEIPDTCHPPSLTHGKSGRKVGVGGLKKSKRKSAGLLNTAPPKRQLSSSATSAPIVPQRTKTTPKERFQNLDKEAAGQKLAKSSSRHIKSLPDWAQRLHRITVHLCQTGCAKPFAREPTPADYDYALIYDAIQPGIIPIGLISVVTKLEQGCYSTPLETFNDIYSVWLSAYRTHLPGSPLWIQAHEASKMFLQQIANEPIRDDFTPLGTLTTSGLGEEEGYGGKQCVGLARKKRPPSTNVDRLFQEFLEQHEGSTVTVTNPSQKIGDNNRRSSIGSFWMNSGKTSSTTMSRTKKRLGGGGQGRRQAKGSQLSQTSGLPITDQERETFQGYLSQLQPHHHLMLYEAFRRTAVWRSVESGEVELDDARTSPPVFRKMIMWCKSQIAVQQPIYQKRNSSLSQVGAHSASSGAFTGSGKILPGIEIPSGGKLSAKSYLESRQPGELGVATYSSSSSSSSSSKSDDDNNDGCSSDEMSVIAPSLIPPS